MGQTEDKDIFDWIDQLDPKDLHSVEEIDLSEDEKADGAVWQRIKRRTFSRLGIDEEASGALKEAVPSWKASRKWLAAACAAIILGTAFISFSSDARAKLKEVLQFIPGFGIVQENENQEQTYVLPKPVSLILENDKITVEGMLIQPSGGQISLTGINVSSVDVKSLILATEQGKFEFKKSQASWGSSGHWEAGYYYEGSIPYEGLDNAILQFGNSTVQLHLTKATTAEDLSDFGSSDSQNGIQITGVVTYLDGTSRKVNLITQLPGRQTVNSYGKAPIVDGLQLELTDDQGRQIKIEKDVGFVKPGELLFDDSNGSEQYRLGIPSILIFDAGAEHVKVTLPVPEEGAIDITVSSQIAGFAINFTRVERVHADSVYIEVDTRFDAEQPKTLQTYHLFTKKGSRMSYTSKLNENTGAIVGEWLSVEPGQKEITFYIGEPRYVVKGPWILDDLR